MTMPMIYPEDKGPHVLYIRAAHSGGFPVCNAEKKTLITIVGPQILKNLLKQLLLTRADLLVCCRVAVGYCTG